MERFKTLPVQGTDLAYLEQGQGPPLVLVHGTLVDARYWAALADDPGHSVTLRLYPEGNGEGTGPSGIVHHRFRAWKEDLRDHDR